MPYLIPECVPNFCSDDSAAKASTGCQRVSSHDDRRPRKQLPDQSSWSRHQRLPPPPQTAPGDVHGQEGSRDDVVITAAAAGFGKREAPCGSARVHTNNSKQQHGSCYNQQSGPAAAAAVLSTQTKAQTNKHFLATSMRSPLADR